MSKHTPGPWEVIGAHIYTKRGAENRAGSRAHESDGWNIATVNPWACTNSDGEDEDMPASEVIANADLLAAAPDLIEALEGLLFAYQDPGNEGGTHDEKVIAARAAIAKARGEA